MIDINNIFHKTFVLCNLNLWLKSYSKSCEVPLNLWSGYEGTCLGSFQLLTSFFDHILLCSSLKITILQRVLTLHDWRVQNEIQYCDPIEWRWDNRPIRHDVAYGSHHWVFLQDLQDLAYKVNFHLCSSTSGLPQCLWFLLRLGPHVKYLLTFLLLQGSNCVENVT